jgi:hypothetical protein
MKTAKRMTSPADEGAAAARRDVAAARRATTRDNLAPGKCTPSNRTHPIAAAMFMRRLGEYVFIWFRPEDGHFYAFGKAAHGWTYAPSWADGTPDMDNYGYVEDMVFDTPEQRDEFSAWLQEKEEWMLNARQAWFDGGFVEYTLNQEGA